MPRRMSRLSPVKMVRLGTLQAAIRVPPAGKIWLPPPENRAIGAAAPLFYALPAAGVKGAGVTETRLLDYCSLIGAAAIREGGNRRQAAPIKRRRQLPGNRQSRQ